MIKYLALVAYTGKESSFDNDLSIFIHLYSHYKNYCFKEKLNFTQRKRYLYRTRVRFMRWPKNC